MTVAYISRPVLLLSGQANDEVSNQVVAAQVEDAVEGLYRCEVDVENYRAGYRYFDRDVLDFGKDIALQLGPPQSRDTVFEGRITGMEGMYPPEGGAKLRIYAEDRLQDLRMTRRTRTFEDMSDREVIAQIARDHSLNPDISLDDSFKHAAVAQLNLSDLAFIRQRALAAGAEVWVEGDALSVRPRAERGESPVKLNYGAALISFNGKADLAHQSTQMRVSGWDVQSKSQILEAVDEAVIRSELNGSDSGGGILRGAFGERKETLVHTVPLTADEARAIAEARYRCQARRFITGRGLADGNSRIRTGARVELSGLGAFFDGEYAVVRTLHTYDRNEGYLTEFEVERAGLGRGR
jgi:phage protein D